MNRWSTKLRLYTNGITNYTYINKIFMMGSSPLSKKNWVTDRLWEWVLYCFKTFKLVLSLPVLSGHAISQLVYGYTLID